MTNTAPDLAALIASHKEAFDRWQAACRAAEHGAKNDLSPLAVARDDAESVESAALAAVMSCPVTTLDDARRKAAYFFEVGYLTDFTDESALALIRSIAGGDREPA